MSIPKIVSSHAKSEVVKINNEPCLKLTIRGISLANYTSAQRNYSKTQEAELIIPLWAIPYMMRDQRTAIAEFEAAELDFIARVKKAYNTEIQPTVKP